MASLPNTLDQALDIAGSLSQTGNALPLTDESGMLGRPIIGQSGVGATISAGPSIVVSGLSSMTVSGHYISITGAINPGNNGSFEILSVISPATVIIDNPGAVSETNISWVERGAYSLEDDLNYARTDRQAIKGVGYDQPVPEYYRCDDQVNPIPANLANIAGHTTDAKSFVLNKQVYASAIAGTPYTTIFSAGNLKHADAVDITGVPVYDGFDAGRDDACFVQITDIDGAALQVLSGLHKGWLIYGRSFGGSSISPDSVNIQFRCVPAGQDFSFSITYTWEVSQINNIIVNYGYRQCLDSVPDTGFRSTSLGDVETPACFPIPNQVGEILFAIQPNVFQVALPVTSTQGWLVNNEGILIVNQVYPDGYDLCSSSGGGGSITPPVSSNYFIETYPMSISTTVVDMPNSTTTYGGVIYNSATFTCYSISALCWAASSANVQIAIYDIAGNRLAISSTVTAVVGMMTFPITFTFAANTRYWLALWADGGCEFAAINSGTGTNPGDTKVIAWHDTAHALPVPAPITTPYIKTVWLRASGIDTVLTDYYIETYSMAISTSILSAYNNTTTYGSAIYNVSRFTCIYIDALCWASGGGNAQVAIYDIDGNRLAVSSAIPNAVGIMSFPITFTMAANTRYCFALWVNNNCEFAAINSGTGTNPGDLRLLTWQDTSNVLPATLTTNVPYIKTAWLRAR